MRFTTPAPVRLATPAKLSAMVAQLPLDGPRVQSDVLGRLAPASMGHAKFGKYALADIDSILMFFAGSDREEYEMVRAYRARLTAYDLNLLRPAPSGESRLSAGHEERMQGHILAAEAACMVDDEDDEDEDIDE